MPNMRKRERGRHTGGVCSERERGVGGGGGGMGNKERTRGRETGGGGGGGESVRENLKACV